MRHERDNTARFTLRGSPDTLRWRRRTSTNDSRTKPNSKSDINYSSSIHSGTDTLARSSSNTGIVSEFD